MALNSEELRAEIQARWFIKGTVESFCDSFLVDPPAKSSTPTAIRAFRSWVRGEKVNKTWADRIEAAARGWLAQDALDPGTPVFVVADAPVPSSSYSTPEPVKTTTTTTTTTASAPFGVHEKPSVLYEAAAEVTQYLPEHLRNAVPKFEPPQSTQQTPPPAQRHVELKYELEQEPKPIPTAAVEKPHKIEAPAVDEVTILREQVSKLQLALDQSLRVNSDLKHRYFMSLGLSVKLQGVLSGQTVEMDLSELFENAEANNVEYVEYPTVLDTLLKKH